MSHYEDSIKNSEWSKEYMSDFIENFEETKRRKRKAKQATLDQFIEDTQ